MIVVAVHSREGESGRRFFRAGLGARFVLAFSLLLAGCSSRISENSKGTQPPENRSPTPDPMQSPADRIPVAGRARRVEDLPRATPADARSIRVEELPAARPVRGRRLRGEHAPSSVAERASTQTDLTPAPPLAGRGVRIDDLPTAAPEATRLLRPEEVTPELVRKADEVLYIYNAPVGTDVSIEVDGKSYVARFALHYHEFGGEKRPWGYHKGVTLYASR